MDAMRQAKRPVSGLAGGYGHPLHPALVSIPVGAWVASLCFDLASHAVHHGGGLAEASRWLIGLGVLGALAAAAVGSLDLFGLPAGTRVRRLAVLHAAVNLLVTAAYAVNFLLRPDPPTGAVGWGPLALSGGALAGLAVGGYLGGELAYRYGVRVADEATQATGFRPTSRKELS